MSYQPETPILVQRPQSRGLIWVEDWYGMWYEKCHIITYLSYTSMRLSSYLSELIVCRNYIAIFGIWCNNVILYLHSYTVTHFMQQRKMIHSSINGRFRVKTTEVRRVHVHSSLLVVISNQNASNKKKIV